MFLKKTIKFINAFILLSGLPFSVNIALSQPVTPNITLYVTGEVTTLPCNITWPSSTIDLGTWSAPIMNKSGSKGTPAKKVTLNFRNCPAETTAAIITFTGTPDPTLPNVFANRAQGDQAAQDVGLALFYNAPDERSISNNDSISVPVSIEDSNFDFYAHMVSLHGASTAGVFSSTVTLNVSWQ